MVYWLEGSYGLAGTEAYMLLGQIAEARCLLGIALARQGQFKKAEPLLRRGYQGLLHAEGAHGQRVAAARAGLIELYEKWGKPEQAASWRKKSPPVRN